MDVTGWSVQYTVVDRHVVAGDPDHRQAPAGHATTWCRRRGARWHHAAAVAGRFRHHRDGRRVRKSGVVALDRATYRGPARSDRPSPTSPATAARTATRARIRRRRSATRPRPCVPATARSIRTTTRGLLKARRRRAARFGMAPPRARSRPGPVLDLAATDAAHGHRHARSAPASTVCRHRRFCRRSLARRSGQPFFDDGSHGDGRRAIAFLVPVRRYRRSGFGAVPVATVTDAGGEDHVRFAVSSEAAGRRSPLFRATVATPRCWPTRRRSTGIVTGAPVSTASSPESPAERTQKPTDVGRHFGVCRHRRGPPDPHRLMSSG